MREGATIKYNSVDATAEILYIYSKEYDQLLDELLNCKGVATVAANLRLDAIAFGKWKKRRMAFRPWLFFAKKEYWRKHFWFFMRNRESERVSDQLFDAIKLGKTRFLDLAVKMSGDKT